MDYNHIKNFLDKTKNIIYLKEENLRIVSVVIEKNISFKIDTKNIKIKPPFIYIKASPLVRNEIMLNKKNILEDIKTLINESNLKDIK